MWKFHDNIDTGEIVLGLLSVCIPCCCVTDFTSSQMLLNNNNVLFPIPKNQALKSKKITQAKIHTLPWQ